LSNFFNIHTNFVSQLYKIWKGCLNVIDTFYLDVRV